MMTPIIINLLEFLKLLVCLLFFCCFCRNGQSWRCIVGLYIFGNWGCRKTVPAGCGEIRVGDFSLLWPAGKNCSKPYFLIKICSQDLFQWGVLVGDFFCLWQHGCIFLAFVELRDMLGSQDATLLVKILQNLAVLISKPYPLHVAAMVMPGSCRHRRKNTQAASPAPTISPQKSTEEAEQNRSRVRKLQINENFKTLKWRYCTI